MQTERSNEAQVSVVVKESPSRETERIIADLATARSELETILANVWIGVVQVDVKRVITRVNRHFEQDMFGYQPGEMLGRYTSILYQSPEEYEAIGRSAYPALMAGKPFSMLECACCRKDGSTFVARLVGVLTDHTDTRKGSIWLFSDITEQKAAEVRLHQTLNELEVIFQNPSVGIIYTIDRKIIRTNLTFEKMLNRSSQELVGKTTRFLYESDWAFNAAGEKMETAFVAGESCRLDILMQEADGSRHTYEIIGSSVDSEESQRRAIWLFTDVTEIRRMQDKLREAKEETELAARAIREKSEQLSSLLDNSDQGFLSFDRDFMVKPAFSRACLEMLGCSPAGRDVANLFFSGDPARAEFFRSTLESVIAESDACIRESMLSLLPQEFQRNNRLLKVEYKILEQDKFMAVLTDITQEHSMALRLCKEQRRLEMIVKAVSDSRNFFDAVEGYKKFLDRIESEIILDSRNISAMVEELYREIHTFKGLFNQFGFPELPDVLHAVESELSTLMMSPSGINHESVCRIVFSDHLRAQYLKDVEVLTEALGEDFMSRGQSVILPVHQAQELEYMACQLLQGNTLDAAHPDARHFLENLGTLSKLSLKSSLLSFNRLITQVAVRLEKKVKPIHIMGAFDVYLDPQVYQPFLRSLAHVVRNACAHGIELPETRWESGKEESGSIVCGISRKHGAILLTIEDDGAGIDPNQLRERVIESGMYSPEEVNCLSEKSLLKTIFCDRISTAQEVNAISGRGVGLAVVLKQTEALGGEVWVTSILGRGTRFGFVLPETPGMMTREITDDHSGFTF